MAQTVKHLSTMRETQVRSLGWDPLEKEMTIHPVLLPGKSHGQRSLVGYSPWGRKESDTTERLHSLSRYQETHRPFECNKPRFPQTKRLKTPCCSEGGIIQCEIFP